MSYQSAKASFADEIAGIKEAGLWKTERVIASDQKSNITLADGSNVVNMCANNYLGLANHPDVIKAASDSLNTWGFGLASVRFICGTQGIHKTLEERVSRFLGMEDTILYAACFDANTGLFETILGPEDAVISDELNHASIIDGVRLCKAVRYRYRNNDMADLEAQLQASISTRGNVPNRCWCPESQACEMALPWAVQNRYYSHQHQRGGHTPFWEMIYCLFGHEVPMLVWELCCLKLQVPVPTSSP